MDDENAKLREIDILLRASFPEAAKKAETTKDSEKSEDDLVENIRNIITICRNIIAHEKHTSTNCDLIIQKNRIALDARNSVLTSFLKSGTLGTPRAERKDARRSFNAQEPQTGLLDSVQCLEKRLHLYMSNEKLISTKLNDANQRLKLAESYLESNDKEINKIEHDIANANKSQIMGSYRTAMSSVQRERKEVMARLTENEKKLDSRLLAMQHRTDNKDEKTAESVSEKTSKSIPEDSSPLIEMLKNVKLKLDKYIQQEMDAAQHFHADIAKQRRHLTDECQALRYDLEVVERKAYRLQTERDKYKRLYDMERIIKFHHDRHSPRYKAAEHDLFCSHNQVKPSPYDDDDNDWTERKTKQRKQKQNKTGKDGKSCTCSII